MIPDPRNIAAVKVGSVTQKGLDLYEIVCLIEKGRGTDDGNEKEEIATLIEFKADAYSRNHGDDAIATFQGLKPATIKVMHEVVGGGRREFHRAVNPTPDMMSQPVSRIRDHRPRL